MMRTQTISLQDVVVQGQGNIVTDMGGEKVMLSVNNGKYYNLGEIGGFIWEAMAEKVSVARLVGALMSEYEVEQSECEQQVLSFLQTMLEEGLIQVEQG